MSDNGATLSRVFTQIANGDIDRAVTLNGTHLAYTTVDGDTYAVTVPARGTVYISNHYPAHGHNATLNVLAMGTEEWAIRDAVNAHQ